MKTSKIVFAKFKIRRARLIVGLIVMTLLFSASIAGGILLLNGYEGVTEYASNGLGGRYFASFNNMLASQIYAEDKDVIADAQRIFDKEKAEKCADEDEECEYEKNEYPFTEYEDGSRSVRITTSAGEKAIINKTKNINNYPESKLDEILSNYEYKQKLTFKNYITKDGGWLYSLIDGEKINDVVKAHGGDVLQMAAYNITYSAGDIFDPYRFNDVDVKEDEIPIFITKNHAEAIMKERGVSVAGSDYEKTITLREKMNGDDGRFEMCFRNGASIEHVSAAITVEKGKEPEYRMKSGECSGVVSEDGELTDDIQRIVKFRVVGIYEQRNLYDTIDEDDLLNNLFKSGLSFSYFVVDDEKISNKARRVAEEIWDEPSGWQKYTIYKDSYVIEFNNAEDVEKIISERDCNALRGNVCSDERPFVIMKYGNSSVFLGKIKNKLVLYSTIVFIVIFALLLVVIMSTINRVLCDSRKETAILRAIGYTRGDIAKIYIRYALIYAAIVGVASFIIGNVVALLVCIINRASFNSFLMVKFGVFEDLNVPLYSFNFLTILCVLVVLLCGVLSTVLPLYLNTRRHIARDLREE